MREVVAEVNVAAGGHAAHQVVTLAHATAKAVDVGLGWGDELAEEGVALHPRERLKAGETAQGGSEIDQADGAVGGAAGNIISGAQVPEIFRDGHEQRHVEAGIRGPAFAARQAGAVVGPVENNRILGEAIGGELGEDDPGSGSGDAVVVERPIAADFRGVGAVGGDGDFGGVVDGRCAGFYRLALVALGGVDDGEERLAGGAVFPVGLSGRGVPDGGRFCEVVVLLGVIGGGVAGFAEERRRYFLAGGIVDHTAHVITAGRRVVETGDDRGARGRADRRGGPSVRLALRTRREAVDVGRGRVGVAGTAELRAVVLTGDPEDGGLGGGREGREGGEGEKERE